MDDAISNIEAVYIYTLQECQHRLSLFSYDIILVRLRQNIEDLCTVMACIRMTTFVPVLFLVADKEAIQHSEKEHGKDKYIFTRLSDPSKPTEYASSKELQIKYIRKISEMIRENIFLVRTRIGIFTA